jgi:hypothetical protein
MLGYLYGNRFGSSQTFSRINIPTFSIPVILNTYSPMKMEQTECSETSAYKIQTPWNYPEEIIQHSEHDESLKSRIQLHRLTQREIVWLLKANNAFVTSKALRHEAHHLHSCYRQYANPVTLCVSPAPLLTVKPTEKCVLLGHYAASSGNFLPTFRKNLSVWG